MSSNKSTDLEERITELESRNAFQDDLIEELNGIVSKQQLQLDRLQASLTLIAEKLKGVESQGASIGDHQQDEAPPHY